MLPFWLLRLRLEGQRKVMKKVGMKIDPCVSIWILEGVYFSLWAFGGPTQFSSNNCTGASSTTLRKTIFFPLKILI
jgi:hypothetical protein